MKKLIAFALLAMTAAPIVTALPAAAQAVAAEQG